MKRFITYFLALMLMLSNVTFPISLEIEAATTKNIALNATVTVSGVEVTKFEAKYMNDGVKPLDIANPTTSDNSKRWSSNQSLPSTPVWTYFDLGSEQSFSQINLYWQKADAIDYDIQISNDKTEWQVIKTITAELDQVGRVDEVLFDTPQSAQYVRVYVRKGITEIRSDVKGVSLYEVEILQVNEEETPEESDNLALGKEVVANGYENNTSFTPLKAVDGLKPSDMSVHDTKDPNYPSRWSSLATLPSTPVWLSVNLGSVKTFQQVDIYWQKANASEYQIEISQDGEDWESIKTVEREQQAVTPRLDQIAFAQPIQAQYVRIYVTKGNGTHGNVGIFELEIYKDATVEVEKPSLEQQALALLEEGAISIENDQIIFPQLEGYTFSLYGSNNQQVIDLNGMIHRPLQDMNVNLILQVQENDSEAAPMVATKNIEILVKANEEAVTEVNAKPAVLPALREWKGDVGFLQLSKVPTLSYNRASLLETANIMKGYFAQMLGKALELQETNGEIVLNLDESLDELGEEGYLVEIDQQVIISAPTTTGLLYGAISITQILYQDDSHDELPKGMIRDYPMYPIRACMLDVGRMYFPIEYVEEIATYMAWYKLNELHLGTNNSRVQTGYTAFRLEVEDEYIQPIVSKDGSYNKEAYRDFQNNVEPYGIDIITEIDTPAHSGAFANIEDGKLMMDFNHLDLRTTEKYDAAISVVKKILDEYLGESINDPNRVIQEDVFHIGTDEYPTSYLTQYKNYTADLIEHVTSKGYKVRLWGSFGSFDNPSGKAIDPTNATINQWSQSWAKAKVCMDYGFDIINTLYNYLYIVPGLKGYPAFLPLESRYQSWDVTNYGSEKVLKGEPKNKGAEFCVWMDTSSYNGGWSWFDAFDRFKNGVMLISEKTWYGEKTADQNISEFMNRVETLGDKVPYANPSRTVDSEGKIVLKYDFTNDTFDITENHYDATLQGDASIEQGVLKLTGTGSIQTPLTSIGHPYTISMDVKMDEDCTTDATLLTSKDGTLYVNPNGNITFKRQYSELTRYVFEFDYQLPFDTWVNLGITCDGENTYLFVDGKAYLAMNKHPNLTVDGTKLEEIDSTTFVAGISEFGKAFKGSIDNVIVANVSSNEDTYANILGEGIFREGNKNKAYLKPAAANGCEVDYLTPNLATDGLRPANSEVQDTADPAWPSRWSSMTVLNETPVWLSIDFEEETTFDKIDIYWQKAKASEYQIQISDDGVEWEPILIVTKPEEASAPRPDYIALETPINARYLRIYVTKNNGEHKNVGIFEVEVYDSAEQNLSILNDEAYALYHKAEQLLADTNKEQVLNGAYDRLETSFNQMQEAYETEDTYVIAKNWNQFVADIADFEANIDLLHISNVNAEAINYKTISLTWDDVVADTYIVERMSGEEWVTIGETNEPCFIANGVKTGKEYTYRIKAIKEDKASISEAVSVTTTLTGEVELIITPNGTNQFDLSWTKVEGATRYIIYRKDGEKAWKKVLTLGKDVTTYTSKAMQANTYQYQVKAARYDSVDRVMTNGSNVVEGIVGLETMVPANVKVEATGTTVTLTWDKVVGMSNYEIYRSKDGGAYRQIKRTTESTITSSGLKVGSTYQFKIRAFRLVNGEKVYTPEVETIPITIE